MEGGAMCRKFWGRIVAAFLPLGSVMFAQSDTPTKTSDELIKRMVAAANRGDVDAFLAAMTDRSRTAVKESFEKPDLSNHPQELSVEQRQKGHSHVIRRSSQD